MYRGLYGNVVVLGSHGNGLHHTTSRCDAAAPPPPAPPPPGCECTVLLSLLRDVSARCTVLYPLLRDVRKLLGREACRRV
ncbi:unnamed protein product [Pleuronectes platessa]|uniref:Uncharacterized protein n=1 Tax=Pleuronectes platessa TaxID=8262 RepID=A0A9N7VUB3_PLEPL|nr:unnamed protein product [Pleuronectes platessa]